MADRLSGVYLTDLTFIEDGIPSLTPSELINFNKRAKTAEVIREIRQYQNVPYLLQPVPELQDYILSNLQAAGDVHNMYDRSLEVEPREREDEKIARYAANNTPIAPTTARASPTTGNGNNNLNTASMRTLTFASMVVLTR